MSWYLIGWSELFCRITCKPEDRRGVQLHNNIILITEGYITSRGHVERHSFRVQPGVRMAAPEPALVQESSGASILRQIIRIPFRP
jgi:hypothetical protein